MTAHADAAASSSGHEQHAGAPPPPDEQLGRFGITATPTIRDLLARTAALAAAPEELRQLCRQYEQQEVVPWRLLPRACTCLREQQQAACAADSAGAGAVPQLCAAAACAGAALVLHSPPPRQRSQQLQQRLDKLQQGLEARQYAAMVADVTRSEAAAAAAREDPFFPSTKLQLSFGLHVIVTMATFYALAYYAARFTTGSQAWAALAGALGLAAGLLLETVLLIVRTNLPEPLEQKYGHLLGKQWDQQQQQQQQTQQQPQLQQAAGPAGGEAAQQPASAQQLRQRRARKA